MQVLGAMSATLSDAADVVALLVLLSEFAMLRSSLSRSQVRLYAFQSFCVSVLAGLVAATRHIGELYGLMGLSLVLKVIIVPVIILRLVREVRVEVTAAHRLGVATMVLGAIVLSVFGMFVVRRLPVHSRSLPVLALALAVAVILVAFLLVIVRNDVVSQAIGFFSLETVSRCRFWCWQPGSL
jgi:hydrogenase-4 component E